MKELDLHCLAIFYLFLNGEVTYEEASRQMSIHGDKILSDILMNGFSVHAVVDSKSWSEVTGSSGKS